MALELSYKAATGSDYSKAYFRVVSIDLNWSAQYARAVVYIHRSKTSRESNDQPVGNKSFEFSGAVDDLDIQNQLPSFDGVFGVGVFDARKTNPVKLVYEHLKTLPEFEDAKDV